MTTSRTKSQSFPPVNLPRTKSQEVAISTWTTPVTTQASLPLIAEEKSVLAEVGINLPAKDLLYAEGTALAAEGYAALQAYAAEYERLPSAEAAFAAYATAVAKEHRVDTVRNLAAMRINTAGRLADESMIARGETGINMTRTCYRQIKEVARNENINEGLASLTRPVERMIRHRLAGLESEPKRREGFGAVGTDPKRGYVVFDGPQVAEIALQGLSDKGLAAKADVVYDRPSTRYSFRLIVQAPVDIPALGAVGRLHQIVVDLKGGDDGMTSVSGRLGIIRLRCLNASLAMNDGSAWTKTHRGQASEIRDLVAGMVDSFGAVGNQLRDVWTRAAAEHYLSEDGMALPPDEAIVRLVAAGHIPTGGLTAEDAVDRYVSAWREEPVYTTAGILMAVQRAAHESTWSSKWATVEIEEAASNLLYQPIYALREVEA